MERGGSVEDEEAGAVEDGGADGGGAYPSILPALLFPHSCSIPLWIGMFAGLPFCTPPPAAPLALVVDRNGGMFNCGLGGCRTIG